MAGLAESIGSAANDLGRCSEPAPALTPIPAHQPPLDDILDDGGDAFVTQFVDHIASLVGDRASGPQTLYCVELLVLSALAQAPHPVTTPGTACIGSFSISFTVRMTLGAPPRPCICARFCSKTPTSQRNGRRAAPG